ncbi:endonuclease/exonuclease/phosphatase family protein [Nonomuraea sp. NPDC048826]|uniref:endonuclease/exonuclease/phosphatase family protein n=1 Tax=Nonomuraea sp. NPDC048826 TaxID=3364347 RepID=UPI0037229324
MLVRIARRLLTVASALVLAATLPGGLSAAQADPVQVEPMSVRSVAPMGGEAAALTAKARGGRARSALTARPDRAARTRAARSFYELQLNLCNSGKAGCYAGGQAIYEGGDLIYYLAPDLVTLNEICSVDLPDYLQPSLAEAWPDDWTYSVFYPAFNKATGAPITCTNGGAYGNAVLGRVPAALWQGANGWVGTYTTQDSGNEVRTFACAYAVGDHLSCATHLSAASEPIALTQCKALTFSVVPSIRSQEGISGKTVIGGDFNLEYDTSDPENAQNCVPSGNIRKGDGDVQHVIFSNDFTFVSRSLYGLTHTDHDGMLIRLTKP